MAYQPYVIDEFKGLDLRDPLEASGSIDLYNVVRGRPGEIRSRDGYDRLCTVSESPLSLFPSATGTSTITHYLLGLGGSSTKTYDSAGSVVDTLAKRTVTAVNFGTTSASLTLCAVSDGTTLQQYDGSNFAAVVYSGTNPVGSLVAVMKPSNRVAMAGSSLGGGSRVIFSDPDDHTTWGANNYVDLTPGDGEVISALVGWGNLLFAFKQTKLFVFYNTSTDGDGNPVFDYRPIAGAGAKRVNPLGASPSSLPAPTATTSEGVFWVDEQTSSGGARIGFTDGVGVTYISDAIEPALGISESGNLATQFLTYGYLYDFHAIVPTEDFLHITCRTLVGGATPDLAALVYDRATREWFIYKFAHDMTGGVAASEMVATSGWSLNRGRNFAIYTDGSAIYQQLSNVDSDYGTGVSWLYRTGYSDFGLAGQQKKIRESICWGTSGNTVSLQVSADFAALDTAGSLSLGSSTPGESRRRRAIRGTVLSTQVSATGEASINRIIHNLTPPPRTAGKQT